jgi:hypothetical protein
LHTIVLRSFRIPSNAIYFRNLGWIRDSRSHRDRRTCASTRRCHSCGARVIAPWSSRPWGRLHRLYRQCLCGSVIPTFGLRGYVSELLFFIGPWAIRGCVEIIFLLFSPKPNKKYR